MAKVYDVTSGQSSQVASHDEPVKAVRWVETPQGGDIGDGKLG